MAETERINRIEGQVSRHADFLGRLDENLTEIKQVLNELVKFMHQNESVRNQNEKNEERIEALERGYAYIKGVGVAGGIVLIVVQIAINLVMRALL